MYKLDIESRWFLLIGLVLFFLVAKEAYTVPLTHDEYNTIFCSQTSIWDIITYKDPVPNNHILNTLLLKLNIAVFGDQLFTNRLHNFLFFIPFYWFTILVSRLLFKSVWLRVTLVLLIAFQPFLLDFFAVTRGYGLSVTFQMISLYYFIKRIKDGDQKYILLSLFWAALGVYANFTLLNYFIPLLVLFSIDSIRKLYRTNKALMVREIGFMMAIASILFLMIIVPVQKMVQTKQFVYWGNKGFFEDTVKQLIISMRSGVEYFGTSNESVYVLVLGFISVIFAAGIFFLRQLKNKDFHIYFCSILLLIILYNITQFYILDIPFLNARTALFFIPIVAITFSLSLESILNYSKTAGLILIVLVNSLVVQHFIRGFNVKVIQEWYYDQNTFEVLEFLKHLAESGQVPKPVKVNCYWIFYPSLRYHVDHGFSEFIELAPYDTKIDNDMQSTFYYTESSEKDKLLSRFDIIQEYGWGSRIIMKAKTQ